MRKTFRRCAGALLLSSFLLGGIGCTRSRDPQTELREALLPLCRALPALASHMAKEPLPPEQAAPLLRRGLEPYRSRFAELSPLYGALSPVEQRRVMASASRACAEELRAFYIALSRVMDRIHNEHEAKVLVRDAVLAWKDSHALWAFELFAQDTVAELKEMAEEEADADEKQNEKQNEKQKEPRHAR